jgi:hypothetical protein
MSDADDFIARWSRLKREAAKTQKPHGKSEASDRERSEKAPEKTPDEAHVKPEPVFDPATLPPIESIVAGSDIRAFLQKGVPAALTKAALRRAWTTDPAIRDFIEVAENQWDFTDPSSIPGFGSLDTVRDLPKLVAQAMGKLQDAPPDPAALSSGDAKAEVAAAAPEAPASEPKSDDGYGVRVAASQHPATPEACAATRRKGHGRALPR